MARVLCVNPWAYDFAAYNQWIEPLGLLSVAAVLRAAGHKVALLDCQDRAHPAAPAPRSRRDAFGCGSFAKVELPKPAALAGVPRRWGRYGLPVELFESELDLRPRPDAVLVTSSMTYWYSGPFEAIRRIKQRWPGVAVALGGVYATLCPDHARAFSGADAVLTGPGEVQGLQWVNQVSGQSRATAVPLDAILPAHDLRRPQGFVAMRTSRGCPFHCPYCAAHQLAPDGFGLRPAAQVVEEIAWCVDALRVSDIAFYDDALLADAPRHIHVILDEVIARGVRVRFHTPNGVHARFIDLALAQKMRRAGFVTIRLGLESCDPADQAYDGGKVDDAGFAQAVQALFEAGFSAREVAAYVLIARPGQSVERARSTAGFAHKLGVPVRLAEFSPIPGTSEFQAAVAMGYIAADADPLLHNRAIYPCGNAQAWEDLKLQLRQKNLTITTAEKEACV